MMALEPPVVGEDFSRGEKNCREPKLPILWIAGEQDGREANPEFFKALPQAPVGSYRRVDRYLVRINQDVPPIGRQFPNFREHLGAQVRVAGCKRDNDRFRLFSQKPENDLLQPGLQ